MTKIVYQTASADDFADEVVFPTTDTWEDCYDDIADSLDIPATRMYNEDR